MKYTYYKSPAGLIRIAALEDAITSLTFIDNEGELFLEDEPATVSMQCRRQLQEFFEGKRKEFDVKLQPAGTAFQVEVWELLREIPFGHRISYLDLAKKYGEVKAIRAVAAANGKNPFAIIVPCHRVVGSNGELVGYAGKLWRKQWLLAHEQHVLSGQTSLFQ